MKLGALNIALKFIFLTLAFQFNSWSKTYSQVINNSVNFTSSISSDATPAVLSKMLKAKTEKLEEINFEKGIYHFYPDKGLEIFCQISNHNDVFVFTAFPIIDLQNMTINGNGSTFIFHGLMVPFLIEQSENITLKNLSIDWATPFHSEGIVVASDTEAKTFDIQIDKKYPYEIRNKQLVFIKEYYEHTLGQTILFDPKTNATTFQTEIYTPLTNFQKIKESTPKNQIVYKYKIDPRSPEQQKIGREDKLTSKEIKPGFVRIYNHGKLMPPVGNILVAKGEQGFNRLAPAIRVTQTKNLNIKDVSILHAGGMGLIVENSENISLDNLVVKPSEGRVISTTADATHFVGCRGKIEIKNCTLSNQLDDAVNIHGTYQEVVDVLGSNTLGVRMGHFQQQGFKIGRVGDKIGLVRLANSFDSYASLTLQSIEVRNGRYQLLTFKEAIPATLKTGDLLENLDAYPEVLIKNNTFSRNRARGLLISTPLKTIIEGNYFSTEMEAILLPVESGFWFESGSVADISIQNNIFEDCVTAGFNRGVIRFVTDDENHNIAFKNITIENNKFNQYTNLIMEVSNAENLKFVNNTITNSGKYEFLYPENPVIKIRASKNLLFEKNNIKSKSKNIFESDENHVRNAH